MGKFQIIIGDITSDELLDNHDLIINPTNPQMIAGAGVSGAIFKKAGVDLLEKYTQIHYDINYFSDSYKKENIMKIGDIRITPGFNLHMDIMFVQGPKKWEHNNSLELLKETYNNMLKKILDNGYKNILIPSLGTGEYGFEHIEVGKMLTELLNNYVMDKDINIDLVLYNEADRHYYI
jgi:O-acetyl-ADP-ribose deacetylase (regulator of RNase III)